MKKNCLVGGAICLLAVVAVGCKTPAVPSWTTSWLGTPAPEVAESKYPPPARVAAVWSPAVLNTAGKTPTRGFGGRLYFYDAANKAVPVEGQLVVYAYNDSLPNKTSKTPDRKYAFTPEQFTEHYSPTDMGASYSIWVPWDEVGGNQSEISLVPIFTATSGQLLVGQSSKNLLPGPTTVAVPGQFERLEMPHPQLVTTPSGAAPDPGATSGVIPASYVDPTTTTVNASGLIETSIPLSSGLTERLGRSSSTADFAQQLAARRTEQMERWQQAAAALPQPASGAPATAASPTPGAIPPPWLPKDLQQARYVRPGHPAPSGPGLPPVRGPLPTPPSLGAPPSFPPTPTPPGPQSGYRAAS